MASKSIEWLVADRPEDALSAFRSAEGVVIEKRGYTLEEAGPLSLTYKRRMAFPAERFTVAASTQNGGSVITVEGKVNRKLRKVFAVLAEQAPRLEKPDDEVEPDEPEESEELQVSEEPGEVVELDLDRDETEEPEPKPAAANGHVSPLVREVRVSGLLAEGATRRFDAEARGQEIDCREMREELQRIYSLVGHADSLPEALEKVQALADDLVVQEGCRADEALYIAYRRSLDEHRDYLAAKGLTEPASS
jgi:hypothetical protein